MLFLLGASDPEMQAIEDLLKACGQSYAYAIGPNGLRVHPGNAYDADGHRLDCEEVIYVECGGPQNQKAAIFLDHHRPGDPGYGQPPEKFLGASSIGQVIACLARSRGGELNPPLSRLDWESVEFAWSPYGSAGEWANDIITVRPVSGYSNSDDPQDILWLGFRVPQEILFMAAADHCLEPAYRGKCPGVDPDALMRWRAESRAAFRRERCSCDDGCPICRGTPEYLMEDIENAMAILRESGPVADLRDRPFIPELPEAACRLGIPFLATLKDRDGRLKTVLQAAPPELVEQFLLGQMVKGVDYYGDPARGFAGCYNETL